MLLTIFHQMTDNVYLSLDFLGTHVAIMGQGAAGHGDGVSMHSEPSIHNIKAHDDDGTLALGVHVGTG